MSNSIQVGYIQKAHSIHGEVFLRLKSKAIWLSKVPVARLREKSGEINDFPIASSRPHKDGLILVLKGVETRNRAEELVGAEFVIDENILVAAPGEKPFLIELLNFEVLDAITNESLGSLESFGSNGKQDLAIVTNRERSFTFPLVTELIDNIDYESKKMFIKTIPGMTEITP